MLEVSHSGRMICGEEHKAMRIHDSNSGSLSWCQPVQWDETERTCIAALYDDIFAVVCEDLFLYTLDAGYGFSYREVEWTRP